MSTEQTMGDWECDMCFEPIDNRPHVRIAVDVAVEEDIGGISSLMNDEVMVLGMFHAACVGETNDDEELEKDVPYLKEARQLMRQLASRETRGQKPPPKASKHSHLRLLNGGTR